MASNYKLRITAEDRTKGAFGSVNKNLNKIKGALAVAFSASVITNFARETLQLADTIGKVADSIGVSTDFLQKYQFAAEQSGLTQEEFNKGMQNFTKMVGQAQLRTSEAGRTLEKLGVQVKNADGSVRGAEEVFVDLFEALDGVGSQFEKNAILADLMGRAGVKLAVMGASGAEAMKELAESATGVIPEKSIRDAERFNDTMNQLKRATLLPLQGVVIGTANAFLDLLEAIGMHTRSKTIIQLEHELASLTEKIEDLRPVVDRLGQKFKETDERYLNSALQLERLEKKYAEVNAKLTEATDKQEKYNRFVADNTIILNENSNAQDGIKNSLETSIPTVQLFANTVEGKLTAAFESFFDFTKKEFLNFKDLAMSVAQAVINELIKVFIIEQLVSSIKSSIIGIPDGINADIDRMLSLDGGGFTGFGARTGGLDGKGGFPAILHPNETVIDHTKPQRINGTTQANVTFNISTVDAKGFDELLKSRKGMITTMVNQAFNSRGKMGIM